MSRETPQPIIDLLRFWEAARGEGELPHRSAFTPESLRRWLGHISVYEGVEGGSDFRIRLEGTAIVEMTGEDWKGRLASEVDAAFGKGLLADLIECARLRRPTLKAMQVFQREFRAATRALLPVTLGAGSVDQIFLCMYLDAGLRPSAGGA